MTRKSWKREVRAALKKIDKNPKDYKTTYKVGNIRIRANVFGGSLDPMFGGMGYSVPLYRLMYKSEKGWFSNNSTHDGVIEEIDNYTSKRVYDDF